MIAGSGLENGVWYYVKAVSLESLTDVIEKYQAKHGRITCIRVHPSHKLELVKSPFPVVGDLWVLKQHYLIIGGK